MPGVLFEFFLSPLFSSCFLPLLRIGAVSLFFENMTAVNGSIICHYVE